MDPVVDIDNLGPPLAGIHTAVDTVDHTPGELHLDNADHT